MQIEDALQKVINEDPIIVGDKTFEPNGYEQIRLKTGEDIFWVRDKVGLWISFDAPAAEVILFHTLEEECEVEADVIVFNGRDYELTVEAGGKVIENDEEVDEVVYQDYESTGGGIIRMIEYSVSGDVSFSLGQKLSEDDIQEIE